MTEQEVVVKVIEAMGRITQYNFDDDDLYNVAQKLGCKFANGATRMTLIFPELGKVIKFPYGAHDYCALEVKSYESAVEFRVEKLLLPIEKVGVSRGGIPLYIQPMYELAVCEMGNMDNVRIRRLTSKTINYENIKRIERGCYYIPQREWIVRATQLYGKKFMRAFEEWTRKFKVNDLHGGNVGYLKGYRPVLIDYAGYNNFW